MTADIRLRAYTPNSGIERGIFAGARSASLPDQLDAESVISWEQPADSAGGPLARDAVEVQVEIRKNGGAWTPIGGRYDVIVTDEDLISAEQVIKVEASSMWDRLAGAIVYGTVPVRDLGEPAQTVPRVFTGQTAMQIMDTLISEERGRGRLTGISVTSTGVLPTVDTIEFQHGSTLDVALRALCERSACQARWAGRTLTLAPVGAGVDRTTGADPVLLTVGRDLLDAPRRRSREGQVSVAMVRGDNGVTVEVQDSTGEVPPFGHAAISIDAPGIQDTSTLNRIGQAELKRLNRERTEWKANLDLQGARFVPGVDYNLGDKVLVRLSGESGGTNAQTVMQIIPSIDKSGVSGCVVVLGDKMPDYQTKKARQDRMGRSGLVPALGSLGDGLGKTPAETLAKNFDPGTLPWNDAWGDMPSTGAGETDCSPSCDCRAPRYPMQIGKASIGSGIFFSSGSYGGRILSVVDHVGINGHLHRASWDPIELQYQHPDHDTLREGSLAKVVASLSIVHGLIDPGEEDDPVAWLQDMPRPDVVYQKNYEWAIHDEIHVHRDFAGRHASYPVSWSSGGAGATHAHRTALVLRSTYMDPDVYGGLFHFAPIWTGNPKLIIEDLGPD